MALYVRIFQSQAFSAFETICVIMYVLRLSRHSKRGEKTHKWLSGPKHRKGDGALVLLCINSPPSSSHSWSYPTLSKFLLPAEHWPLTGAVSTPMSITTPLPSGELILNHTIIWLQLLKHKHMDLPVEGKQQIYLFLEIWFAFWRHSLF